MTKREFLKNVIDANVNDELTTYAQGLIDKMDAGNEKRKGNKKPSKNAEENQKFALQIMDALGDTENGSVTATDVASLLDITTQRANGVLGVMVKNGDLVKVDVGRNNPLEYRVV